MPAHLDEMNLLRKRKLRRYLDELSAYLQTSYLSQNTIPFGTVAASALRLVQSSTYICARFMRHPLFAKTFLSDDLAGGPGPQRISAARRLSELF